MAKNLGGQGVEPPTLGLIDDCPLSLFSSKKAAQNGNGKYNGGRIVIWGFAASGLGQLCHHEGEMNSNVYQGLQQDNLKVTVCRLKLVFVCY